MIVAQKLGIPKTQLTDQMKFKKREEQSMDTLALLRRGNNMPIEEIQRQNVEKRLRERRY